MCKSRSATKASDPSPRRRPSRATTPSASSSDPIRSYPAPTTGSTSASSASKVSSSSSSSSLAAIRGSLPSPPAIYPFAEIAAATNNFLAKRFSSSSSSPSWRCSLRGKDVVVFQRAFRGDSAARAALPSRLSDLGKSHHKSLVRLLGASLTGDYIYLVYEFAPGASLAHCLRNPRNPNFTPLPTWTSRIQIAVDVAQGLEYIHQNSATIHNRIKSSAVLVTDPDARAKICHFGAAALAGEVSSDNPGALQSIQRSSSRRGWIDGTRGYMAPEVIAGESVSRRSDVYAFGVVLLELVSGEEPVRYRYDKERKEFEVISLIETAAAAEGEGVRWWVDRRLRDSFPLESAEKLIHVALRCVDAEPAARPEMTWVAGKISKLYLESKAWEEKVRLPTDFSVSIAPR